MCWIILQLLKLPLEIAHIISIYFPLAKARHMATPNFPLWEWRWDPERPFSGLQRALSHFISEILALGAHSGILGSLALGESFCINLKFEVEWKQMKEKTGSPVGIRGQKSLKEQLLPELTQWPDILQQQSL